MPTKHHTKDCCIGIKTYTSCLAIQFDMVLCCFILDPYRHNKVGRARERETKGGREREEEGGRWLEEARRGPRKGVEIDNFTFFFQNKK